MDDYTLRMLSALYPAPARVLEGRSRGAVTTYLAVPSRDHPRLLVPAGHPVAASRSAHRQLAGRRPRTRAARAVVTALLRSRLAARAPRAVIAVASPPGVPSVETVLVDVLGADGVLLTMPVGPARANRKPVLQVTDTGGRDLAYVKVGHDMLTRALVRREAGALEQVAAASPETTVVPRVVAHLEWQDLSLLVLTPLALPRTRLGGRAARTALERCVVEIAAVGGRDRAPGAWAGGAAAQALRGRLADCGDRAAPLRTHLDRVLADAPPLRAGSWHGDLNPGNLALAAGGTLVWDWERFEAGAPLGFDLLHHDLTEALTVAGDDPLRAARDLLDTAPRTLGSLGVEPVAAATTARLYLLTIAARYLQDRQDRAGSAVGRVEEWVTPALDGAGPTTARGALA